MNFPPVIYWSVLLITVPVIIFFIYRRTPQKIMWGGMFLLRNASQKIRFRMHFLEILLVTIQTIIIALCVSAILISQDNFTFTDNFVDRFQSAASLIKSDAHKTQDTLLKDTSSSEYETSSFSEKHDSPDALFIFDNSASMSAVSHSEESGKKYSRIKLAQQCATKILMDFPENFHVAVLPMISLEKTEEISSAYKSSEAIFTIQNIPETDAAIIPDDFLKNFEQIITKILNNSENKTLNIYIFSDFQWKWTESERMHFRQILQKNTMKITCVKVISPKDTQSLDISSDINVGIIDIHPVRLPIIQGEEMNLELTLRNYSQKDINHQPVELFQITADTGSATQNANYVRLTQNTRIPISQQWVNIPAGEEVKITFKFPVTHSDMYLLEASLGNEVLPQNDFYPADDVRRIIFYAVPQWKILIIEPWQKESQQEGVTAYAGTYLGSALEGIAAIRSETITSQKIQTLQNKKQENTISSTPTSSTDPKPQIQEPLTYLNLEKMPDGLLSQLKLQDYDTIFLCGISQFSQQEIRALREYLNSGGALFIFPEETLLKDNYAHLEDILPGLPIQFIHLQEALNVAPSTPIHPAIRFFSDYPHAGLNTLPVLRYWKLRPEENSETILSLANSDPFLLTRNISSGQVLMFSISPHMQDTPFALSGIFVPLLDQLLLHASGRRLLLGNIPAGEIPLAGIYQTPAGHYYPQCVINPDPQEAESLMLSSDETSLLFFDGIPCKRETPYSILSATETARKNHLSFLLLGMAFVLLISENLLRNRMK
ncbi:MAG: hypothetical protein Q4C96_00645 [Planctomycetia bacterium]|nr:hypothetical protein [Planctomycetia bacterium]